MTSIALTQNPLIYNKMSGIMFIISVQATTANLRKNKCISSTKFANPATKLKLSLPIGWFVPHIICTPPNEWFIDYLDIRNCIICWCLYSLLKFSVWKAGKYRCNLMMTSSNGNISRVTGLLCGEFTDHQWILRTKASDAELWCFLWSAPEPTVEQTMETLVYLVNEIR